ncbi:glycosyltransferase involved in cell wall biosynthesis [Salinibacter ruber]|nr:glycosyltransferase involved in cell wall biosynthesis [Salinibacter ruber]
MSILSMRRSERVIFPTAAMRDKAVEWASSLPEPCVIQYGFNRERFVEEDEEEELDVVRRVKGWREQGNVVLLYVSFYAVHKNFETLTDALRLLKQKGWSVKLVTTTSRETTGDKEAHDRWQQRIDDHGLGDNIFEAGTIEHGKIHRLYRASDLFVFPSFTESFGHPMVEAMASGLPIVAADTAVNREICGSAGAYHDTFDPASCAQAIERQMQAGDERAGLTDPKQRAREFSWQDHTRKLIETFRSLVEEERT